jgi:hypothetical protein
MVKKQRYKSVSVTCSQCGYTSKDLAKYEFAKVSVSDEKLTGLQQELPLYADTEKQVSTCIYCQIQRICKNKDALQVLYPISS